MSWTDVWEPLDHQVRRGGQGRVVRVRRKSDAVPGALKLLHIEHQQSRERRFRMYQEVKALEALAGRGTPTVIETNVDQWADFSTELYTITAWVEGPTLADHVAGRPGSINDALTVITALLGVLDESHKLGIHHRDLKPDNVILRHGNLSDPVLVDFGMSWFKREGGEFETDAGQELGNRFLRLPEYAPGHHLQDSRSDLTMVVGLLFYMLAGAAPRVLRDAAGRKPHECDIGLFRSDVRSDPRWPRLVSVFDVGFEDRVDWRFQTSADLRRALTSLDPPNATDDSAAVQLERLKALISSEAAREKDQIHKRIRKGRDAFIEAFQAEAARQGLAAGGGAAGEEFGQAANVAFGVWWPEIFQPNIQINVRIERENAELVASYRLTDATVLELHRGPIADVSGLEGDLRRAAPVLVGRAMQLLHDKLSQTLGPPTRRSG